MKNHLMPLIPETFNNEYQQQIAELGSGGADLVAVSQLVGDAKANIIGRPHESEQVLHSSQKPHGALG
jgi:hypothetical protein